MVAVGCSVSIADLLEVFPENADDYIRQAYYLCLKNLMVQLGHIMQRFAPNEKITIFHDWTDHLSDHFKSGQRLSLQNRPTEGTGNLDVLPRPPLFRQV